jgi:hypothetical protein
MISPNRTKTAPLWIDRPLATDPFVLMVFGVTNERE